MKKLAIFQNIVNGFFMFSSSFHNPLQSCSSSGYHQLKFCVVEDQFISILLLLHQFNENSSFFLRKKIPKFTKKRIIGIVVYFSSLKIFGTTLSSSIFFINILSQSE